MKGTIFNLFEQFLDENYGEDSFFKVHQKSMQDLETKEPFVGPKNYPDADMMCIVAQSLQEVKEDNIEILLNKFGEFSLIHLLDTGKSFMKEYDHPKPMLQDLDGVIHVEVKKVFSGANPPRFYCIDEGEDKLTMIYESERKMYDFYEGLITGLAKHYNMKIDCVRDFREYEGKEMCHFDLTFEVPYV